jgi:hypothetical protein
MKREATDHVPKEIICQIDENLEQIDPEKAIMILVKLRGEICFVGLLKETFIHIVPVLVTDEPHQILIKGANLNLDQVHQVDILAQIILHEETSIATQVSVRQKIPLRDEYMKVLPDTGHVKKERNQALHLIRLPALLVNRFMPGLNRNDHLSKKRSRCQYPKKRRQLLKERMVTNQPISPKIIRLHPTVASIQTERILVAR